MRAFRVRWATVATMLAPSMVTAAPAALGETLVSAASMTSEQVGALALYLNAPGYYVVPGDVGVTFLTDDRIVRLGRGFGDRAPRDERLKRGVFWNAAPVAVLIRLGDDPQPIALEPNEIIAVGDSFIHAPRPRESGSTPSARRPGVDAGSCQVDCTPGFHACCMYGPPGGQPTCRCLRKQDLPADDCDAGGEGSSSCSLTQNP